MWEGHKDSFGADCWELLVTNKNDSFVLWETFISTSWEELIIVHISREPYLKMLFHESHFFSCQNIMIHLGKGLLSWVQVLIFSLQKIFNYRFLWFANLTMNILLWEAHNHIVVFLKNLTRSTITQATMIALKLWSLYEPIHELRKALLPVNCLVSFSSWERLYFTTVGPHFGILEVKDRYAFHVCNRSDFGHPMEYDMNIWLEILIGCCCASHESDFMVMLPFCLLLES